MASKTPKYDFEALINKCLFDDQLRDIFIPLKPDKTDTASKNAFTKGCIAAKERMKAIAKDMNIENYSAAVTSIDSMTEDDFHHWIDFGRSVDDGGKSGA